MSTPYPQRRERRKQISDLLMRGFSNKAIAAELLLAESTIKIYVSRLYETLGLSEADPRMNTRVAAVLMLQGEAKCKIV